MIEYQTIPERRESGLASHLVPLKGGQWALWRTLAVRGAGFPAIDVLRLGDATCGVAADCVVAAEAELKRIRSAILENLESDLKRAERKERRALEKTKRRIEQGQLPELTETQTGQAWAADLLAASHRLELLTQEFHSAFSLTLNKTSRAIREIASDERFQEAVIWQNRAAWHRASEYLSRKDADIV